MMDALYHQVLERNGRETTPFVSVHEANAALMNQVDALQTKCEALERENATQQQLLNDSTPSSSGRISSSHSASLKNEARLRDKLERLQEELNEKLKIHSEAQTNALKAAKELAEAKDLNIKHDSTVSKLREDIERRDRSIEHLSTELADAKARTKLAEQQYVGLKDSIRILQEENDLIKKENRELEARFVSEKEKLSEEMNILTEMVERLKREVDMLRSLKEQEEKRKSWFGQAAVKIDHAEASKESCAEGDGRKWGSLAVVLPTQPFHILQAHKKEASVVR